MKQATGTGIVLLSAALLWAGCSKEDSAPTQPASGGAGALATVTGTVYRQGTTTKVPGAIVSAGGKVDTADANGKFQLSLSVGAHTISAQAPKYNNFYGPITVPSAAPLTYDSIGMIPIPWDYYGNTIAIPGPTGWEFASGLNNTIYFATPNNTGSQQHFIAYDLPTNTYAEKSLTGNPLCACGYMSNLVASSNKLYYFANDGMVYTPVTNTWSAGNYPAANRRGEAGVAVNGDDIYFVGGRGPLNTCQVYNATTNTWKSIANYPIAISWSAAVSYNGQIYVLGGTETPNKMARFNPVGNTWTTMPEIPFANLDGRPKAVVFDKKIFFFSGVDIYQYDLVAGSWLASVMSSSGFGSFPVVAGDALYLVGYSSTRSGYAIAKYTP